MKKDRITTEILQEMAGDIEKMLIEEQQQIEWAFRNVQDGFKLSISVNIEHTIPPTAEYNISYPLEPAREPIQKQKRTGLSERKIQQVIRSLSPRRRFTPTWRRRGRQRQ